MLSGETNEKCYFLSGNCLFSISAGLQQRGRPVKKFLWGLWGLFLLVIVSRIAARVMVQVGPGFRGQLAALGVLAAAVMFYLVGVASRSLAEGSERNGTEKSFTANQTSNGCAIALSNFRKQRARDSRQGRLLSPTSRSTLAGFARLSFEIWSNGSRVGRTSSPAKPWYGVTKKLFSTRRSSSAPNKQNGILHWLLRRLGHLGYWFTYPGVDPRNNRQYRFIGRFV